MNLSTAVVIFAPHEVQAIAVPILRQYALDSLIRVPPHITLMFPFVPFEQLDSAAQTIKSISTDIRPFDVTLSSYDQFPGVIFMQPANPEPIKAVFKQIYDAFPLYPPYGGAFGNDLHPHVTVGEFKNEAEQRAVWLPDYAPITFRAERVHLIYGIHREPFPWLTHSVIAFGGK
jgi:2'-5' RNA ligase